MKTLLRLFFVPRLKNIGLLLVISIAMVCLSIYTSQWELLIGSAMLSFMFLSYVAFNSHMTENVEWLKNSAFDSKKLFMYYLLEQTLAIALMGAILLMGTIGAIFGIEYFKVIAAKDQAALEKTSHIAQIVAEESLNSLNYFSVSEKALETVFLLFFIHAVIYGAELIKTYFIKLKFERRYTKEAYFFNGLIVTIILFIFMKDTSMISRIINMKIVVIPMFIGVVSYSLIIAANNTFKMFKQEWKSWQSIAPLSIAIAIFIFSLVFSKLNYGLNKNMDEVIAEQRFQWVFSPYISEEEVASFYLNVKHVNNLEYLIEKFPHFPDEHFYTVLNNRDSLKGLIALTKLWKLEDLTEKKLEAYMLKFDKKIGKVQNERKRKSFLYSLFINNEEFWIKSEKHNLKSESFNTITQSIVKEYLRKQKRNISSKDNSKKKEPSI